MPFLSFDPISCDDYMHAYVYLYDIHTFVRAKNNQSLSSFTIFKSFSFQEITFKKNTYSKRLAKYSVIMVTNYQKSARNTTINKIKQYNNVCLLAYIILLLKA